MIRKAILPRLLIALVSFLSRCALVSQTFDSGDDDAYRFGFIDMTGREIVKPMYERAREFREGLAPVRVNGLWGFIDQSGAMVIAPKFYDARPFGEGLAAVKTTAARMVPDWGFIDKAGAMTIAPKFYAANRFANGHARVTIGYRSRSGFANNRHAYIAKSGSVVVKDPGWTTYLDEMHWFADGRFPVVSDGRWGFMDASGRLAVPAAYYAVRSFAEGRCAVALKYTKDDFIKRIPIPEIAAWGGQEEKVLWGYIDADGREIIIPSLPRADDFSDGRALVNKLGELTPNGLYFIDAAGGNPFGKTYYAAEGFDGGIACVQVKDANVRFIDPRGKTVIDAVAGSRLVSCGRFSEGAAPASVHRSSAGRPSGTAVPVVDPRDLIPGSHRIVDGFINRKGDWLFDFDRSRYVKHQNAFTGGRMWFVRKVK